MYTYIYLCICINIYLDIFCMYIESWIEGTIVCSHKYLQEWHPVKFPSTFAKKKKNSSLSFFSFFIYTRWHQSWDFHSRDYIFFSFLTRYKFLDTKAVRQNSSQHRFSREVKKCEEHRFCFVFLSSFPKTKLCGTVVETKRQGEYAGLGARVGRIANAECWRAKPVGGDSPWPPPGATLALTSAAACIRGPIPRDQLSTRRNIGASKIETVGGRTTAGHGPAAANHSGRSLPSGQLADVVKIGTRTSSRLASMYTLQLGIQRSDTCKRTTSIGSWDGQKRPRERSQLKGTPFEGPLTWSDTSQDSVGDAGQPSASSTWSSLSLMMISARCGLFAGPSPSRGLGTEKALLVHFLRRRAKMRKGRQRANHRDHCPPPHEE